MHQDNQPLKPYDGHPLEDASEVVLGGANARVTSYDDAGNVQQIEGRVIRPYASADINNDTSNVTITDEMTPVVRITAEVEIYGDPAAVSQHMNAAEGIASDFARAAHNACSPRLRPSVYGMSYRIETDQKGNTVTSLDPTGNIVHRQQAQL